MAMDTLYKVMIVDDHPLFRRGLQQLFDVTPDVTVVGEFGSGEEALESVERLQPDLIMLDMNMKGMDGIATLTELRARDIDARIVMLTVSDAEEDVVAALSLGADGYLLKDTDPLELSRLLRSALDGKMVLSEQVTAILASQLRHRKDAPTTPNADTLTEREWEVLHLLAKGKSNKMVARELDVTEGTVKVHVKNLLKKLGLKSRLQAAVWVMNYQQEQQSP
ncbi:MAG: two-component system response regulator NarL [Natronospirillum sp.]